MGLAIQVTEAVCETWIDLGRGMGAYAWGQLCLGTRAGDGKVEAVKRNFVWVMREIQVPVSNPQRLPKQGWCDNSTMREQATTAPPDAIGFLLDNKKIATHNPIDEFKL